MFINMISIPMKNKKDLSVLELLQNVATSSISYFKNAKYPYMHLLKDLRSNHNGQNYNVVYSFQNMRPKTDFPNLVSYHSESNIVDYKQDEFVINVTYINNSGN